MGLNKPTLPVIIFSMEPRFGDSSVPTTSFTVVRLLSHAAEQLYTRAGAVSSVAGRVWLVQALECLPPPPLHQSQTLPRSLKPEVSPTFEGRDLFQLLSAMCDLKNLSTVVIRL